MDKDGFRGAPISALKLPQDFYTQNRDKTLQYLSGVYPTATESLRSLTPLELASFYNSL